MKKALLAGCLAIPLLGHSAAQAQQDTCSQLQARASADRALSARASALDNRLVVFPYHENGLYTVHTHFGLHTHFEFEPGEKIVASYVNDETLFEQKVAEVTGRDVFVRALVKGAIGGFTVITNKRRYQIELFDVSNCSQLTRYQRVSWRHADGMWQASPGAANVPEPQAVGPTAGEAGLAPDATARPMTAGATGDRVDVARLNLEYQIEGDADIRPLRVFDDGSRTWIQFAGDMALRPAIFVVNNEGRGEPVEYVPHGNTFVLARTFSHGLLLKLGRQEARVRNLAASGCRWFDSACRKVSTTNIQAGP